MSGITSGVGIFSGIDRNQIISQLLALDARPKAIAQKRIGQLQGLSVAYLDINSRLSGLKSAAAKFATLKVFDAAKATSGNTDALTAVATPGAAIGNYQLLVDRLASSQQILSQGFTDSTSTGLGLTSITFENALGRLDRDTKLSTLNGGAGVARGRIQVTDSSGATATVDLSRAESVNDVLTALNGLSGVRLSAKIDGDRLVVTDAAGGAGRLTIADAAGYSTATSLGIAGLADATGSGGKVNGAQINRVGAATSLRTLNDGLGVQISNALGTSTPDFTISTRSGETLSIDIGPMYNGDGTLLAPAVTDLGGVIQRINTQSAGKVTASINAAGTGLRLVDNTTGSDTLTVADVGDRSTAADLGIAGTGAPDGTLDGQRLLAGLNSVLARNLRGGNGIEPGLFEIVARDGSYHAFSANFSGSVTDFISSVASATGGKITLALNASGTGFDLTDNTNGSGPLTVAGTLASDLGLSVSAAAVSSVRGNRAQMKYVGLATRVSDLNNGRGIGTGRFEITNSYGERRVIDIGNDTATIDDLVREINAGSPGYTARINNNGDGIVIEETVRNGVPGGNKIAIRDLTGTVAKSLNLVGTASGTGSANYLDGSFERTVALAVGDTLTQVAEKINQAGVNAAASVVNDGSPSRPFRLSLTGRDVGEGGRFTIDTGAVDLGFSTLAAGSNSRVFFGAADPASAILFSTSGNSVTGILANVTIDLKSPRSEPVTLTVTRDNQAIEDAVSEFVAAFNQVVSRIDAQSTYDADANKRGTLLGDSTTQSLRSLLLSTVQGPPLGVSGRYQSLTQVGITVGRNGQLQVDSDKLRTAIANDPQAVKDLFVAKAQVPTTGGQPVIGPDGQPIPGVTLVGGSSAQQATFTSLGIMERIGQLTDQYINSTTGTLTRRARSLDTQIKSQNDLIASLDKKLESRRTILERQFVRMEQAIGQLQSQQGALGNIRSATAR